MKISDSQFGGPPTRRSEGHDYRQEGLDGARIGLAHNTIPTAVSAVTTMEGATYGAR